ncbi:MobA/MobL family protein [Bosea sp. PAMC 26642]|uniref:MobA/MobL family protein n=1 Tax=Bosea sp. (strain PAMC 26642) TaxID=1792307 RepID=UPI00143AF9C3|nr:MobA/MobL family protein [Bosea sp. PAMC 26642]
MKRAADRAAKDAKKRVQRAGKANMFRGLARNSKSSFEMAMGRSLSRHFGKMKSSSRPSIKMKAPDTGGRPFHFDHTAVSHKTIAIPPGASVPGEHTYGKRKKEFAKPKTHTSKTSAHMAYIEREGAEESFDLQAELGRAIGGVDGRERSLSEIQGYLEDEEKIAANAKPGAAASKVTEIAFSFGTEEMGETTEERMAFCDLVEEHPERANATLQHRFILELPHECSAVDRRHIMEEFTQKYRHDRVPFWVVLHAPVAGKNDSRNFHAHIVLLNRPAWKEAWPEGGKHHGRASKPDIVMWNFAASELVPKTRGKGEKKIYPLRQKVPSDYRDHFVGDERKRFAEVVNARMIASGVPVRYDARSYKDMGLEVEAMKSVKKMIEDKVRSGDRLRIDNDLTKRLVEHEIDKLTRERAAGFATAAELKRATQASLTALLKVEKEAQYLGRRGGLAKLASSAMKRAYRTAALRFAQAKERHVTKEVALAHERLELERLVKATDPDDIKALTATLRSRMKAAVAKDPKGAEARRLKEEIVSLDPHHTAYVHDAAKVELGDLVHRHSRIATRTLGAIRSALGAWREVAEGKSPSVLPKYTAAVLQQQAEAAQRAAQEPRPPQPPKFYPSSADEMIDAMFFKPHHQLALKVARQITGFIAELGAVKVPGKSKADVVREGVHGLIDAFKKGPLEAQAHMATAPEAYRQQAAAAKPATGVPKRAWTPPKEGFLRPEAPWAGRPDPVFSVPTGPVERGPRPPVKPIQEKPEPKAPITGPEAEMPPPAEAPKKRKKKQKERQKAILSRRTRDFDL